MIASETIWIGRDQALRGWRPVRQVDARKCIHRHPVEHRPISDVQRGESFTGLDSPMGLLTFSISVTLDGCVDHQEGIADDETHAFFTRLMDEGGAMLWGRVTYEMMENYWPEIPDRG